MESAYKYTITFRNEVELGSLNVINNALGSIVPIAFCKYSVPTCNLLGV